MLYLLLLQNLEYETGFRADNQQHFKSDASNENLDHPDESIIILDLVIEIPDKIKTVRSEYINIKKYSKFNIKYDLIIDP